MLELKVPISTDDIVNAIKKMKETLVRSFKNGEIIWENYRDFFSTCQKKKSSL